MGDNGPHLVPIVFAAAGDTIFTAVDGKPKKSRSLRRLANIEVNPAVAVLVDYYDDDWRRLWWVRADGLATIVTDEGLMRPGLDLLTVRYEQYREERPAGPVIEISVTRWMGWQASGEIS
jgi:PPOX class probable F420-dependent enzyme